MPSTAVYVGRPSVFANPFVGPSAVEAFRRWVEARSQCAMDVVNRMVHETKDFQSVDLADFERYAAWTAEAIHARIGELRGKDLACWCGLGKTCHADILLAIANR